MPDADPFAVISETSETLRTFIETGFKELELPPVVVHTLRTRPQPPLVTLTLFDVQEDPSARNRPRVRTLVPDGTRVELRKPDMALHLRYLITAWSDDAANQYPYSDQLALGRVLQLFYDTPILSGPLIFGDALKVSTRSLSVSSTSLSLEDQTRIWHTLQLPYRVSLTYEVRVINLKPEKTQEGGVVLEGHIDYAPMGNGR